MTRNSAREIDVRSISHIFALPLLAAMMLGGTAHTETWIDRAKRNYELLARGQKSIYQLTKQERVEVRALEQLEKDRLRDKRTPRQRCLDEETARAGGSPSELERGIIDLKCSQR